MTKQIIFHCLVLLEITGISTVLAEEFPIKKQQVILPRIDVVDTRNSTISQIPASNQIISKEDLSIRQPISTEAALKIIPGISIKPEEESAIVGNIGMRGLSAQDYKTLILEDGVPISPGAFTGNQRYYNPRIQRMESIEVLKGAGSLRYGPSTIGGVINYKTKEPYDGLAVTTKLGTWNYKELMVEAGGKSETGDKIGGINFVTTDSDGFQDKAYQMKDLMLKGGIMINDTQWLSLKLSHYDNDANISYRGLFLKDYFSKARYNPAPDDYFFIDRNSIDLNHEWYITPQAKLNTLFYWNKTNRDYWRYGVNVEQSTLAGRWVYTDTVVGGKREFERFGIDSRLQIEHTELGIPNKSELGLYIATETMDSQNITATRADSRSGIASNLQEQSAFNWALFAENRFLLTPQWTTTLGLRLENYRLQRTAANYKGTSSDWMLTPGVGMTYQINPAIQFYGSGYKAFAPPQISDAINATGLDKSLPAEESFNYEFGLRGKSQGFHYEATAFFMDFKNQNIPSNSGGYVLASAGKTLHRGIEGALGYDFTSNLSIDANCTYIPTAKFKNGNTAGNRITYSPELITNLGLTYKYGKLTQSLRANYVSAQYTDAENTEAIQERTTGFFIGKIGSYATVDWSGQYAYNKQLSFLANANNLFDRHYIASLRQGIYVGPSRSFILGIRYSF